MFCEMVKMDAIVRHDPNTFHLLDFSAEMQPIGGQLCGSKPEIAGKAASIIEDLGFTTVDLNCGCPVDKVTKDGSGSGLLKNPQKIGDIINNMVAAVNIPVTIKIRAGWDDETINAAEITQIAEAAGAAAICIHGRTRKQAYRGPAEWEWIKACKEVANTIKVIGNGDVTSGEAAQKIFEQTGCDAVLVARGTMGQPWVAEDIRRYLEGKPPLERTPEMVKETLMEHFEHMCGYHPERKAIIEMRRIGCWYVKKGAETKEFRGKISKASTFEEVKELITNL